MQNTSELFKTILKNPLCVVQNKVTIAGKDYFDDTIESLSTSGSMFSSAGPCIGSSVSRTIEVALKTEGSSIPRAAEIDVFIRLVLLNSTGAVESASEWIPKGVFYIDTRELDASGEWISIHGYDAMLKGEQTFLDQANGDTGLWPQSMSAVASACAEKMGVEIDEKTALSSDYKISYPSDYTCRELLQYIAAAHCGNWVITDSGKLRLVPFGSIDADNAIQLDTAMMDFTSSPAFQPFTRANLLADDEHYYTAGDDTGRTLEADCPWATQAICDAVLERVKGYQYVPYTAMLDPAAEIGDTVCVNGRTSILASVDTTFCAMFTANIAAPADEEIDHEYPYKSSTTRKFDRKLASTKAEIKLTTDSITARVEAVDGKATQIQQTVDGITLEVTEQAGADGQVYARISLQIGPNKYSGLIKMEGNLEVSGQLSADALYARSGDIADLTVNRLSTSRRIIRYLARDMSDDSYVSIHDEQIEFISGVTDGSTVQAQTPDGLPIYWEADISGAEIASNGFPYIDGQRIFTTTAVTPWPVTVYAYKELVKASQHFDMVGEYYLPVFTFGAGDGTGGNIAWLTKEAEALKLLYRTSTGKALGLIMSNNGYMDAYGLRRTTFMDFSEWSFGKFYESLEGVDREIEYGVQFDDLGRPVKITEGEHVCDIRWGDNL